MRRADVAIAGVNATLCEVVILRKLIVVRADGPRVPSLPPLSATAHVVNGDRQAVRVIVNHVLEMLELEEGGCFSPPAPLVHGADGSVRLL